MSVPIEKVTPGWWLIRRRRLEHPRVVVVSEFPDHDLRVGRIGVDEDEPLEWFKAWEWIAPLDLVQLATESEGKTETKKETQ